MRRREPFAGGEALRVYAFLYLAFLYVPVLLLPLFSFNNSLFIAFPLSGFTTRWYAEMAADSEMHAALVNTLKVGVLASLSSTILGLLAAKALARGGLKGGGFLAGLTSLPLFIPEIVLGISLLILVTSAGIGLSLASVAIGHLLLAKPRPRNCRGCRIASKVDFCEFLLVINITIRGCGMKSSFLSKRFTINCLPSSTAPARSLAAGRCAPASGSSG